MSSKTTQEFFSEKTAPLTPKMKVSLEQGLSHPELSDWQPGILKWFNMANGYGFVTLTNGRDAMLHATVIRASGFYRYSEGMPIEVRIYPVGGRLRVAAMREASNAVK